MTQTGKTPTTKELFGKKNIQVLDMSTGAMAIEVGHVALNATSIE